MHRLPLEPLRVSFKHRASPATLPETSWATPLCSPGQQPPEHAGALLGASLCTFAVRMQGGSTSPDAGACPGRPLAQAACRGGFPPCWPSACQVMPCKRFAGPVDFARAPSLKGKPIPATALAEVVAQLFFLGAPPVLATSLLLSLAGRLGAVHELAAGVFLRLLLGPCQRPLHAFLLMFALHLQFFLPQPMPAFFVLGLHSAAPQSS